MAESIHNYRIKESLLKKSLLKGFELEDGNCLVSIPNESRHNLISKAIDGIAEGAKWGRLRFQYNVREDMVLTVYAIASDNYELEKHLLNPDIPIEAKRSFLENENAVKARYILCKTKIESTFTFKGSKVKSIFVISMLDFFSLKT